MSPLDPHAGGAVRQSGAPLAEAAGAIILLHGRGANAEDILSLSRAFHDPRLCYLAPQAAGRTWYPNSFLAPRDQNEPYLTSALRRVHSLVAQAVAAGLPTDRIFLCGFSQGACLSTEFVASHPARYAGLIAFTGGLIGPLGSDITHTGALAGTPALLASGDPDPHVPWSRVEESAEVLRAMGAQVATRRYPNRPHTIAREELDLASHLIRQAAAGFAP